ncbi:MAG TPA: serine hydrolase domain-containing protein [Roseiflexaceae bacterium]|nr:serine hydrolase domain-containing protein [Roseiflexaceae bacterium]
MTDFDTAGANALFAPFDRPDVPGAAAIVVRGGRVRYRAAFGAADLEARLACTPATNFRLASVTKQFTALAVMLLAERGALGYDEPIARFFDRAPAAWQGVTIRQLLTHTSGLVDFEELIPPGTVTPLRDADVLKLVMGAPQTYFPPGAAYRYSNTGYCLLALIVECVAGRPFAAFLREAIFAPLGMRTTLAYEAGVSTVPNRAYGYSRAASGWERTDQSITSSTLGDGGVYSSVEDLALWDRALVEGRLVRAEALTEAFAPAVALPGGGGYGFGWYVGARGGLRLVYHTGETVGFRTAIVRVLERSVSAVVLCNRSEAIPLALAHALVEIELDR